MHKISYLFEIFQIPQFIEHCIRARMLLGSVNYGFAQFHEIDFGYGLWIGQPKSKVKGDLQGGKKS